MSYFFKKLGLSKEEFKTFFISALSGSLEFYDFIIYVFFAQIIAQLFFDTRSQIGGLLIAFTVYACGFVSRILGGIVFSHFGDKKGRKNSFATTILLMAIPTFLIGLLPTYQKVGLLASLLLVLCRVVQGLALGGELPCSITFVYEHAPNEKKGLACGILTFGFTFGVFLGSIVGTIIVKSFTEEHLISWGWRLAFLFGGILGVVGIYLRRKLQETPVFKLMKKESVEHFVPFRGLMTQCKTVMVQKIFVCLVMVVCTGIIFLYFPVYLQIFYKFSADQTLIMNSIFVLFYAILIIPSAILCDKVGDKKVFITSSFLLSILAIPCFYFLKEGSIFSVCFCYIIISCILSCISASQMTILARAFPTKMRYSGVSLCYNLAAGVVGAFTPLICTKLIDVTKINYAPSFYLTVISLGGFFAILPSLSKSFLISKSLEM